MGICWGWRDGRKDQGGCAKSSFLSSAVRIPPLLIPLFSYPVNPFLASPGSRSEFINIYCRGSFLRGLRFGVGFYGYRAAIRGERRWKEDCLLCASLWDELHTIVQWNDASVTQQESEWDGPTNRTLAYQPSCLLLFSLNQQRLSAGSGGWQWIYFCPEDDFGGLFVQQVDIFWFGLSKLNIHFK